MQDLNDLYYFVQSVEHGGFTPAGRALSIPKSKLSRRIALLEERLGVRLVQRSTRKFTVTAIGQNYYEHCKAMMVEAEAAQDVIDMVRAEPRGVIRLVCPITLLHVHVADMLADFMAINPQVEIQLEATNRTVDLVSEGIDIAIRVRPPPLQDSDLVMRVFSDRGQSLVASPELVQRLGLPQSPADLANWPSLGAGLAKADHHWQLSDPTGAQARVMHTPRFSTSDRQALKIAALRGIGVVQIPNLMIQQELTEGKLVKLLPEWAPRREIIHAVFPSRRGLLPSVRALLDHLAKRFGALVED